MFFGSMQYILILFWLAAMALFGYAGGMHRKERVLGRAERRATWAYAIIMIVPIIAFAGMRDRYFGDTSMYYRNFLSIPADFDGKIAYIQSITKDTGFYAFGALLSMIIGDNVRVYFTILAAIQLLCLAKTYRKYSEDFWFAMFLFVATTDIYSWMFNGIRQFTAVTIIFAASGWLFKKKLIRFSLAVAFASLFHQSALLMIPIAFIVQGRAWNWKTLTVIFFTVLAIAFVGTFTNLLGSALEDTQYRNVVSDWQSWEDDGTNPLRVLVYAMPTLLSLLGRRRIKQSDDRVMHICCNLGIISTALYMISMVTSGIFIGRLPIYCSLYANGILLPWELKHMFTQRFGRVMRMAAIACYLVFYVFQVYFVWGML